MLEEKIVQWENDILQKGIAQGLSQGLSQGIAQGRSEGMAEGMSQGKLMAYQEIILDILDSRFGEIPSGLQEAISGISDPDLLSRLTGIALKAASAQEIEKIIVSHTALQ